MGNRNESNEILSDGQTAWYVKMKTPEEYYLYYVPGLRHDFTGVFSPIVLARQLVEFELDMLQHSHSSLRQGKVVYHHLPSCVQARKVTIGINGEFPL
ncbi:hypothetical protein AVEN_209769-1 [Araneus ventricosus]|uniref:Uncharacterized protein n=1 Tax=Araneus ventricosus TaxID=182803 RepID=A0A4Y2CDN8_ARAVE|nr:hypothetical protein AVEN_209769-1 [Araneus ventricosus]